MSQPRTHMCQTGVKEAKRYLVDSLVHYKSLEAKSVLSEGYYRKKRFPTKEEEKEWNSAKPKLITKEWSTELEENASIITLSLPSLICPIVNWIISSRKQEERFLVLSTWKTDHSLLTGNKPSKSSLMPISSPIFTKKICIDQKTNSSLQQ